MDLAQLVQLSLPAAGDVDLRALAVRGREALHAPFSFEITCAVPAFGDGGDGGGAPDWLAWIGETARLSWAVSPDEARAIEGVVDAVVASPPRCTITLVPRVAARTDACDYRVFVDADAIEIATAIFDEHGVAVEDRTTRKPAKRAERLQTFEGDLDFVARALADDGIAYHLAPDGRTVILADHPSGYREIGPALPIREGGGLAAGDAVSSVRLARRVVVTEVALRDYDFERPLLDLAARAGEAGAGLATREFPGGYRDPEEGKALAAARLEEAARRRLVLTGETAVRTLYAGGVLRLVEGARDDMNGDFLLVEVAHEIQKRKGDEPAYVARFSAIPLSAGYRPDRVPAPPRSGVQTATVAGPRGAEIHTEQHARVRVEHRWDRRSPGDDRSSAWARTAQPATSGSIFLPRAGWEVLAGFTGFGRDEPLILGRLHHGHAPPPESLPDKKVVSALGTLTTPGGGGGNRIATDDSAGSEGLHFVASKDLNERSENDKVTAVKGDDTVDIGAKRELIVGAVLEEKVDGARTLNVAAHREAKVGANLTLTASSDTTLVGGARVVRTGGDNGTVCSTFARVVLGVEAQVPIEHQTRFVEGGSIVVNAGTWQTVAGASAGVAVGGASALSVGGAMSIQSASYAANARGFLSEKYASRTVLSGGAIADTFKATGTYEISGAATFTGTDIVVTAMASLTIKAGGVVVQMSPGKIKVSGRFQGTGGSDQSGESKFG